MIWYDEMVVDGKVLTLPTLNPPRHRWQIKDKVGDVEISTVFLTLDHNYGGGEPILYETMIFGGKLDQEQFRYCTRDEAIKGHQEQVERVKESEK